MRNPGPDDTLNDTEIDNLRRLETAAQRGLGTYTEVGEALAEIREARLYRGTHSTFEAYLRERWGINDAVPVRREGSEAVEQVCQLETHPFDVDDRAREQLRDDVLVIEEELATLKMLLADVDWNAEFQGLLGQENSPPETDAAAEDE